MIDRCFGKRRLGKRWKRRQYLQQRVRQERLHPSRKWKFEVHGDTFTIKSSEKCRSCKQVPVVSDSISGCSSDIISVDDELQQPLCEDDLGGASFPDVADLKSKKGLDLEKFTSGVDCDGENDTYCVDACKSEECYTLDNERPLNCICGLGDMNNGTASSQVSQTSPKHKRQSDYLYNPKPSKSRRSTEDQTDISLKYHTMSLCDIEDHLPDGFYDAGRDRPFMSLGDYEQNLDFDSREVILLDRLSYLKICFHRSKFFCCF